MNLRLMTEVMYKSQCWTLPYGMRKMYLLLGNIEPVTNDRYFKNYIVWINFKISRAAYYMTVLPTKKSSQSCRFQGHSSGQKEEDNWNNYKV